MSIHCPSTERSKNAQFLRERGSVAGSLRQRGTHSWHLRVHAGRDPRRTASTMSNRPSTGPSVRRNEHSLNSLPRQSRSLPGRGPPSDSILKILLDEWLDHAAPDFSPKTVSTTRGYIETTINPLIGDPCREGSAADLDRFYRHLPGYTRASRCTRD